MSEHGHRTISDQLRDAITGDAMSRYRLAQLSGVTESALSRFVRGERGLDLSSVDRLAAVLQLELISRGRAGATESARKRRQKFPKGRV